MVIAVAAVVIVVVGVFAAVKLSARSDDDTLYPAVSADSVDTSTDLPSSSSATTTTSTSPTSTTSTTSAFALPSGFAGAMPVDATVNNPITTVVGLAHQYCRLPPWPPDGRDAQAFLDVALGCLDMAWHPVMAKLGLPFKPARLELTANVATQECGRPPEQNSFYCDNTIYLDPESYLRTNTGVQGVPTAAVSLLAHEYGHHIQQLSGTMHAAVVQMNAAGRSSPAGLELSRRAELQAQCLSGMFIGSTFDTASIQLAQQDNYTRGDAPGGPADHGQAQSFGDWFTRGATRDSLDVCNTWIAPPDQVR